MRKLAVILIALCLLLTGCRGWMDGSYVSIHPHQDKTSTEDQQLIEVETYVQMRSALEDMVERGVQNGTLSLVAFSEEVATENMDKAVRNILTTHPIGTYAVESIDYELGTSGTIPAVAVSITYKHNQAEIQTIKQAENMEEAAQIITNALDQFESGVVMRVSVFEKTDFAQLLQDYADTYPEYVMEIPQITVNTYPNFGNDRVVEVIFTYQSNRESLRTMQKRVADVFSAAKLYVSGDGEQGEKYAQLYAFLMERFDYRFETSITPSYSLLCHGVGDNRAFAVNFAAMCHRAELECYVVSGTREGEPWFWNIICEDGTYRHVDLIANGSFEKLYDEQMQGYVWDYSGYPACSAPEPPPPPEDTIPVTVPQ